MWVELPELTLSIFNGNKSYGMVTVFTSRKISSYEYFCVHMINAALQNSDPASF